MINRPIEFRAWHPDDKVMIYNLSTPHLFLGKLIDPCDKYIFMQFTGLRDKSGKEIYEGDIVKNIRTDIKYAVKYSEKTASYTIESTQEVAPLCGYGTLEIIGNIFENKELLTTMEKE